MGRFLTAVIAVAALAALVVVVSPQGGGRGAAPAEPTSSTLAYPGIETVSPVPAEIYEPPLPTAEPMSSANAAIEASLEMFPGQAREPIARLVSARTLLQWTDYSALSPPEKTQVAADLPENERLPDPDKPVWLVAILGTDLTVGEILGSTAPGGDEDYPAPAEGAYYAWDANSGDLKEVGALPLGSAWTYASIAALSHEDIPIVRATRRAPKLLVTPLPAATYSPNQVATFSALETEQYYRYQTATPTGVAPLWRTLRI
jgi:hypothetical protein